MTLGTNLSLRITAILVFGFVLLQLTVFTFTTFLGPSSDAGAGGLPQPAALAAICETFEQSTAAERPALLEAFNGSLYTVSLAREFPAADPGNSGRSALEQIYGPALGGRPVRISGRQPLLGIFNRGAFWPGRILSPTQIAVGLKGGGALVVDSRPSSLVRGFLNRRAFRGALGGLIVLAALALAVRQTTRPLVSLSRNIRTFAGKLDAPALPVEGSREMRDLAAAYNEMRERIAGLVSDRTRVLAAVAHDMRTYLTRLRLRVEFIADEAQRTKAVADLGEMSALLDDTLLFAGTETAAPPLEALDLAIELEKIVTSRKEIGEPVLLDLGSSPLPIRANRLSLRRMLANLIENGLRHGRTVEIAAAATHDGIAVEVRDDGPGVPPDALARLGMPFQRLDPSRDRETGGAGLGLAIVRALAARQGAQVTFANRVPQGFAARIAFPRQRNGESHA